MKASYESSRMGRQGYVLDFQTGVYSSGSDHIANFNSFDWSLTLTLFIPPDRIAGGEMPVDITFLIVIYTEGRLLPFQNSNEPDESSQFSIIIAYDKLELTRFTVKENCTNLGNLTWLLFWQVLSASTLILLSFEILALAAAASQWCLIHRFYTKFIGYNIQDVRFL